MKITKEILKAESDWRALYLESGVDMLGLAAELLTGGEGERELGLKIVEGAWFEEDAENVESKPSLADVSFQALVPLLEALAPKEPRAVFGLLVACREDGSVMPDEKVLLSLLEDDSKKKVEGLTVQRMALRMFVHTCGRTKQLARVVELLQKHVGLTSEVLDEVGYWVARDYDLSPLVALGVEGAQAKSETRARTAITLLNAVQKTGADISAAVPYLIENQKKLASFSDVLEVLGGYYLRHKKYDELEAWLQDPDLDTAARAYRAVRWGIGQGADGSAFLVRPGVSERLDFLMTEKRLPSQAEVNSFHG